MLLCPSGARFAWQVQHHETGDDATTLGVSVRAITRAHADLKHRAKASGAQVVAYLEGKGVFHALYDRQWIVACRD